MVGWPTRWDSSVVERDHPHHPQQQQLQQQSHHPSGGFDVTVPLVPTTGHNHLSGQQHRVSSAIPTRPNHNHHDNALQQTSDLSCSQPESKIISSSLDRGPFIGEENPILNHSNKTNGTAFTEGHHQHLHHSHNHRCHCDPVITAADDCHSCESLVKPSCSCTVPSCSRTVTTPGTPCQSPVGSFECDGVRTRVPPPSCIEIPNTNHCHSNHSPLLTSESSSLRSLVLTQSASLNGTSRTPCDVLTSTDIDENNPWNITETSPLKPTNGEIGRFRVNGVAKMRLKDETVAQAEGEEEDEEEAGEEVEIGQEEEEEEMKCGLGDWCSPPCVQKLANKQMFLMVFCLTTVLQGMFYTYFVSVLTTIERLFQLKSKTTGIIMSATEMGQIGGGLLLTYYGGHGHRPKWIGWGIVLFAFCALLSSLPHFVFGPDLLKKHLEIASSRVSPLDSANTCQYPEKNLSLNVSLSYQGGGVFGDDNSNSTQQEASESGPCEENDSHGVLAIFFLSLLGVGIGQTAAYNLGIPYIDDNVNNRETPLYFAGSMGVKILGPTLGFVLGSLCTRLYVSPLAEPGITTSDPRWIGAWWLGLVIVSVALFLTSAAMFAFPRRLPMSSKTVRTVVYQAPLRNPSLRDFPKAVGRLLKNEILMLRTASSVLHILPIAGLYTFLPKYLESQFRLPVHNAAMVSGIGGILVMGIGIFGSGIFIRKAKPTARTVAAWIALTALVYSIGMIILMFVGCPQDDFVGLVDCDGGKQFVPQCERTCGGCDESVYAPVCDSSERTHFSACHLGCSNVTHLGGSNKLMFSSCECLPEGETAELRLCELNCGNFVWYIIIFSFFVIIHSTSEVGGMLLTLRCVEPKDKAMALGLISVAIGLFGNVPCPIIYGAVVDSACIQWKKRCKEQGACQLYDSDIFRMFFHGITGAVMLLAFIVDVVVWHKAKSVSFNEDDKVQEEATPMNPKSSSPSSSVPPFITEQTPTTSTALEISPIGSTSDKELSVNPEGDQLKSCV